MGWANLVEAINNLDRQFAIRWVCDVLLMHGRVDMNHIFQRLFSMQTNAHPENPLYTLRAMRLRKCTSSVLWQGSFCWNSFIPQKAW